MLSCHNGTVPSSSNVVTFWACPVFWLYHTAEKRTITFEPLGTWPGTLDRTHGSLFIYLSVHPAIQPSIYLRMYIHKYISYIHIIYTYHIYISYMHVRIHIYIYIYTHICVPICIYTCVYIYIYTMCTYIRCPYSHRGPMWNPYIPIIYHLKIRAHTANPSQTRKKQVRVFGARTSIYGLRCMTLQLS